MVKRCCLTSIGWLLNVVEGPVGFPLVVEVVEGVEADEWDRRLGFRVEDEGRVEPVPRLGGRFDRDVLAEIGFKDVEAEAAFRIRGSEPRGRKTPSTRGTIALQKNTQSSTSLPTNLSSVTP